MPRATRWAAGDYLVRHVLSREKCYNCDGRGSSRCGCTQERYHECRILIPFQIGRDYRRSYWNPVQYPGSDTPTADPDQGEVCGGEDEDKCERFIVEVYCPGEESPG